MVKGELPYKQYYVITDDKTNQHGDGNIKIVTPTQAAVDQAKLTIKRKVEEEGGFINKRKKPNQLQSGGRRPRANTGKKSPKKSPRAKPFIKKKK